METTMPESRHNQEFVAIGPRVEELLTLQHEFFTQLDSLSAEQSALVDGERTPELLELLGRRQRLIDGIAEINGLLAPARAQWSEIMAGLPEEMRLRVNRRLDALAGLAARIAQRDEADRARLEGRRDAVAGELARVGRARGAIGAYAGPSGGGARFQDREA
jgi:hypothetical protein